MYQNNTTTTILDMADVYAIGQNQTSAFFEKYPQCKADPEQVIVVFVQDADLPPCMKDKAEDGQKLAYSPRGFEAAVNKGKLTVERGNNNRLVCVWKDLTLDYNVMVFYAKVYNAARKNAEAETPKEKGQHKETKAEKALREENEKLQAAIAAKDQAYCDLLEQAEFQDKANKAFTEKVAKAVADLLANSQPKARKGEAYTAAASSLKAMLNLA